jgi:arabinogalactan oligomer/maltooligosaccharide transport system permease protein
MKRPGFVFFFFLLFAVLVLGACEGSGGRKTGTIRIWHAYRGDEEKALNAILAAWKGEPLEVLSVPFDAYQTKLRSGIPVGEGPDIFIDAHERLGDYLSRGIVGPVGDALEGEDVFMPSALAAVRQDGETYALPLSQKCIALYVNTSLVKGAPEFLEDFSTVKGALPPGTFPLVYEAQNAYFHAAILGAFGGSLLTDKDEFGLFGPGAERSIEIVRGLIDQGVVPEDADGALVANLFRSGRAAFAISGPWLANDFGNAPNLKYRVEPLPRVRAAGEPMRPMLTVESVMMSPKGATRPEVRKLVRLIAGADAARIRTKLIKVPLVRTDVDVEALGLPEADKAFLKAFTEQAKVALPLPSSTAMGVAWDPANKGMKKALRERALSPGTVLAEAKSRFDRVRGPKPPPASPVPAVIVVGLGALALTLMWLRKAKRGELYPAVRRSLPAYKYVAHAVIVLGVVVFLPLVVGAMTSLFVGTRGNFFETYVGLGNFIAILAARGVDLFSTGSFYVVLATTVLWTISNVFFHVVIGVALALVLSRPNMRLRGFYRVLLIIPWAVPSYVTALSWKGMFHRQFGAVTGLINAANEFFGLSIEPIAWFSRFSTAFTANLTTNVWLGFPFMMVVTLGALTAVPEDVLEAAKVDGASRFQRLRLVTLPMIAPTIAPAVTLGAVWTFNMFNVIYLVSGGDPDGSTEILVTEAYRWAFNREGQYGYAAAYSVLIFLMLYIGTRVMNRRKSIAKIPTDAGGTQPGNQEPGPKLVPAAQLPSEVA